MNSHLVKLRFDLPGCGAWIFNDADLVDECVGLVSVDNRRYGRRFPSVGRQTAATAGSVGTRQAAEESSGLLVAGIVVTRDPGRQCGGPHGKPRIEPQVAGISIGQSDGLTCLALAAVNEAGVDITLVSAALYELPSGADGTGHLVDTSPDLEARALRWSTLEAMGKVGEPVSPRSPPRQVGWLRQRSEVAGSLMMSKRSFTSGTVGSSRSHLRARESNARDL